MGEKYYTVIYYTNITELCVGKVEKGAQTFKHQCIYITLSQ